MIQQSTLSIVLLSLSVYNNNPFNNVYDTLILWANPVSMKIGKKNQFKKCLENYFRSYVSMRIIIFNRISTTANYIARKINDLWLRLRSSRKQIVDATFRLCSKIYCQYWKSIIYVTCTTVLEVNFGTRS